MSYRLVKQNLDLLLDSSKCNISLVSVLENFKFSNSTTFTYLNPFSIQKIDHSLLSFFHVKYIDGILLSFLLNLLLKDKIKRNSFDFTSNAPVVFSFANRNYLNVCLVGSTDDELSSSITYLAYKYPNIDFSYSRNGYFTNPSDFSSFISNAADVDIFIFGMGTPLQEKAVQMSYLKYPFGKLFFTCGAFITQISRGDEYYNPILNKLNLRWLQRLFENNYVWKRLLFNYPLFLFYYIRYCFRI